MKRIAFQTADGSNTLFVPELNEHYHSKFGALTESLHVFIKNGYRHRNLNTLKILEVGLGSGLNAVLTLKEAVENNHKVYYESVEKYPLTASEIASLNYNTILEKHWHEKFNVIHELPWEQNMDIGENFCLQKRKIDLLHYHSEINFDVIYFDAFAPDIQPELWKVEVFQKLRTVMNPGGVFVTYSSKGTVKRNLTEAGFQIEKLKGPPGGKREVLRAFR